MKETTRIVIFTLFGLAMLMPWNTWIESSEWFKFKLVGTIFAQSYGGYVSVTYQIFNMMSLIFFLKYKFILPRLRIIGGFLIVCAVFIVAMMALCLPISTTSYFWIILALVAISSAAVASLASLIALAGTNASICMTALYSGQGMAGILPLIIQLFSHHGGQINEGTVVLNGALALIITIGAIFGYQDLTRARMSTAEDEDPVLITSPGGHERSDSEESAADSISDFTEVANTENVIDIFKVIAFPCTSICINLGVTLSVFPYVTAQVESIAGMTNFVLLHFFIFNIFDWLGKTCTVLKLFNVRNPKLIFQLSLARALFIPAIMACNLKFYHNGYSRWFPSLFGDVSYIIILGLFSFTNGNFGS